MSPLVLKQVGMIGLGKRLFGHVPEQKRLALRAFGDDNMMPVEQ